MHDDQSDDMMMIILLIIDLVLRSYIGYISLKLNMFILYVFF